MFEAVELGRAVTRDVFKEQEAELRTDLLKTQRALQESDSSVIVIVNGVEGAGRGDLLNRLHKWLDARGIQTHGFWDESDEERERPRYWRFWRRLPARGNMGIFFGAWYRDPLVRRVIDELDQAQFDEQLHRNEELERMLHADGALVIKFWLHISRETQSKRIKKQIRKGRALLPLEERLLKHHPQLLEAAERMIRVTDTGENPWYLVESEDHLYRDLTVGRTLLQAMQARLETEANSNGVAPIQNPEPPRAPGARTTVLEQLNLDRSLAKGEYQKRLDAAKDELNRLTWAAKGAGLSTVVVLEGWDAAGKGGALRRIAAAVDARLMRVISIGAPSDEERAHHYLWRFWRHIPRAGRVTIYDRSWYGRVLVERVEGFAAEVEWMRAFQEINDFEEQLIDHGMVLLKFWLHISAEEQLQRFKEREQTPWKQHKITEEDWRNRDKREDYLLAVNDMVARTSTAKASWHLVSANDKRHARVEILETMGHALSERLNGAQARASSGK